MPSTILILAEELDLHADVVIEMLHRKGHRTCRFEVSQVPAKNGITVHASSSVQSERITVGGASIPLDDVTAIWNRRVMAPSLPSGMSRDDEEFARNETQHLLNGLWGRLQGRFWVNWIVNERLANRKPYQLKIAKEVGLDVPDTLITNEPAECRRFFTANGGRVIYKPLNRPVVTDGSQGYSLFTSIVSETDLDQRLASVAYAPCLFQAHLPKVREYRVIVIDGEVFPVAIDSQVMPQTSVDWRRCQENWASLPHRAETWPVERTAPILALMRRLGLVFGALDFVLTPDGRCVFLEVNPSGQWYWLEMATGIPLADRMSDLLIRGHSRAGVSPLAAACLGGVAGGRAELADG